MEQQWNSVVSCTSHFSGGVTEAQGEMDLRTPPRESSQNCPALRLGCCDLLHRLPLEAAKPRAAGKKLTGKEQPDPQDLGMTAMRASQRWHRENIDFLANRAKFRESCNSRLRKSISVS